MDIELVDGAPVYFGSYSEVDEDGGMRSRAVVWHGLDAQPVVVGPGSVEDIAYDLTPEGLVLGGSWDGAQQRPWVVDLDTGELTWVRTSARGAEAPNIVARRLNASGAMTGAGPRGKGKARAGDALAWDSLTAAPRALPAKGRGAQAFAINDQGDRAGHVEHVHLQGNGTWTIWDPTVWYADGTVRTAARAGLDARIQAMNESGQMAGNTWWGNDPEAGHYEAAFWPSVDEIVSLGVLESGAWSMVWGMDDGGSVVGQMERLVADSPLSSPWGTVEHNFLWQQGLVDAVRILPSLHAEQTGEDDWREWYSMHAAHAVHTGLDQVGAGTHVGFDAETGAPVGAPTVFVGASSCGTVVETTHGVEQPMELNQAKSAVARAEARNDR